MKVQKLNKLRVALLVILFGTIIFALAGCFSPVDLPPCPGLVIDLNKPVDTLHVPPCKSSP